MAYVELALEAQAWNAFFVTFRRLAEQFHHAI
jgi:hypothetical protein